MWTYINYIFYAAFLGYIGYWLFQAAKNRTIYGIYEACGMACFFSILFLSGWKPGPGVVPLTIVGLILFVPAIFFGVVGISNLRRKGKPTDAWELTTVIVESGVFRIVRHPLYLGTAIWAVGLMLVFQSVLSIVLGTVAVLCCWMASRKEDQFNLNKFGDEYESYLEKVPMWNFVKGAWNLKKPGGTKA